jgi:hypothetical protein
MSGGVGLPSSDALASVAQALTQADVQVFSNARPDMLFRQMTIPRQYFHSKTGQPILPNEVDCDSDDDVDESWILHQGERVSLVWRAAAGCVVIFLHVRGPAD